MEWYDRAKSLLAARNLSREAMRQWLGVEESTLRSYLNGTRTPDIRRMGRIADFLDVSVDELLGRKRHAERVEEDQETYIKHKVLLELFDAVTKKDQEAIIRELEEKKHRIDEIVTDYLKRHKAG